MRPPESIIQSMWPATLCRLPTPVLHLASSNAGNFEKVSGLQIPIPVLNDYSRFVCSTEFRLAETIRQVYFEEINFDNRQDRQ